MLICDVCLAEREELWGFPVSGFHEPLLNVIVPVSEWAVCDDCKPYFDRGDANGLTRDRAPERRLTAPFYMLLMAHVAGPMAPIRDQDSPLYK